MPPELIRLKKPRFLITMVLVLILLGFGASIGLTAMHTVDYPFDVETTRERFESGQPIELDADRHARIEGAHTCTVTGDVVRTSNRGPEYFETGTAGTYTITCGNVYREPGPELVIADRYFFDAFRQSEDMVILADSVLFWTTVGSIALLAVGLAWYASVRRKRTAQLAQFQAAGLPEYKQGSGTAVAGLVLMALGMLLFAWGLLRGPIGSSLSLPFILLGVVLFVGGGGVKEDQLRRYVDGWREWYAKQQQPQGPAQNSGPYSAT